MALIAPRRLGPFFPGRRGEAIHGFPDGVAIRQHHGREFAVVLPAQVQPAGFMTPTDAGPTLPNPLGLPVSAADQAGDRWQLDAAAELDGDTNRRRDPSGPPATTKETDPAPFWKLRRRRCWNCIATSPRRAKSSPPSFRERCAPLQIARSRSRRWSARLQSMHNRCPINPRSARRRRPICRRARPIAPRRSTLGQRRKACSMPCIRARSKTMRRFAVGSPTLTARSSVSIACNRRKRRASRDRAERIA